MESPTSKILILCLADASLSRDRMQILEGTLKGLQPWATTVLLPGQTPIEQVLKQIKELQPQLVLVPWKMFLTDERLETVIYGLRPKGPISAGYWCETSASPWNSGLMSHAVQRDRWLLLNACRLEQTTVNRQFTLTLQSLFSDPHRSGVQPLLTSKTPLWQHHETWDSQRTLGSTLDLWERSDVFQSGPWRDSIAQVRTVLLGCWQWAMEEGPGDALVQCVVDPHAFWIRIVSKRPGWNLSDTAIALKQLGNSGHSALHSTQFFARGAAQWIRVQSVGVGGLSELTVGMFPQKREGDSEAASSGASLILMHLGEHLLQQESMPNPKLNSSHSLEAKPGSVAHERHLKEARQRIAVLQQTLRSKEIALSELRSGGVGTAAPIPPPDAETLIEAFQMRFEDISFQISALHSEIQSLAPGAPREHIAVLEGRVQELLKKQREWIRQIYDILKIAKAS